MSCVFIRELDRESQQYSTDYLYKVLMVHAMISLCLVLMSITHLLCIFLKTTIPCSCALISYSLISIIYACTMCTLWETPVPWYHSISRLFLILLDSFRPMISCYMISQSCALFLSRHRLIIIPLSISYLICPKVCPHFCLIIILLIYSMVLLFWNLL